MTPHVSVITASYNYGHYLPQALDSILAQTFPEWESIIVDDGSTDDTPSIVRPYLRDPRFRYIRTENRGQAAAENTGVQAARGEYIAFLDADDVWRNDKLDLQLPLFDVSPRIAVVYSRRINIGADAAQLPTRQTPLYRGQVTHKMFRQNFVCFSSSTVRRGVFSDVGLFDESCYRNQDYDLWLRISAKYEFDYVDAPLVFYRMGHTKPNINEGQMLLSALEIMDRFLTSPSTRPLLPRKVVRQSYAETYAHIGEVAANRSLREAIHWFRRAVTTDPLAPENWRAMVRTLMPTGARSLLSKTLKNSAQ